MRLLLRTRVFPGVVLAVVTATAGFDGSAQSPSPGPRFEISFARAARTDAVTGMVYLAISRDNQRTPIEQADTTGVPLFSKYVEQMNPDAPVTIAAGERGHPIASLKDIPAGEYWVQPFVNVYT